MTQTKNQKQTKHQNQEKLEFNRRAIGKTVFIVNGPRSYYAEVKDVVDEETFLVKYRDFEREVSIFDIRYLD